MVKRKDQLTEEAPAEILSEDNPVTEQVQKPAEVSLKEPAEVKLSTTVPNEGLAPAQSKAEIEAAIQEKLSRRDDKAGSDPFVPSVQLDNEVKQVANKNGFPLSRGTEIGARLMARAKRN